MSTTSIHNRLTNLCALTHIYDPFNMIGEWSKEKEQHLSLSLFCYCCGLFKLNSNQITSNDPLNCVSRSHCSDLSHLLFQFQSSFSCLRRDPWFEIAAKIFIFICFTMLLDPLNTNRISTVLPLLHQFEFARCDLRVFNLSLTLCLCVQWRRWYEMHTVCFMCVCIFVCTILNIMFRVRKLNKKQTHRKMKKTKSSKTTAKGRVSMSFHCDLSLLVYFTDLKKKLQEKTL